jgi:hypothetical protein
LRQTESISFREQRKTGTKIDERENLTSALAREIFVLAGSDLEGCGAAP